MRDDEPSNHEVNSTGNVYSDDHEGPEQDDDQHSLFHINMPGIVNPEQLTQAIDLDRIKIKVGKRYAETQVCNIHGILHLF